MNVTLTITAGPHSGREFTFDRHDTFLVGRSKKAHFRLSDDKYFSREHFLVEVNPPLVRVLDLNSRNGIVVNGQRVKSADLKDGDELKAGHMVFKLRVPDLDPDLQATLSTSRQQPPPLPSSASTALHTPTAPPIPGYALGAEVGRGAMGIVYRAARLADGAAVAVKVITPAAGVTERDVGRFLREARIMAELEHPNIVRCLDSGEVGDGLYLVMQLVTGPDLRDRIKDRGPQDVRGAVLMMTHALNGLAHAHAKGFVHRDIKPANLLLDGPKAKRTVRIADFGLARAFNDNNMSGLTMQGDIGGTPAFMAPEQVTHYRDARPAADQYAAAATLYYLLTGQFVLDFADDGTAQMIQIVTDERVPLRARRPDVPAELEAVVMKALALDPEARYRDVAALRDAIRPFA